MKYIILIIFALVIVSGGCSQRMYGEEDLGDEIMEIIDNPDSDYIYLINNRLIVEIAKPGTIYNGSRFDWTGFITGITLDEQHDFLTVESPPHNPAAGTGGRGLSNEFGITDPVGFEDAATGEKFPKIGVGLLTKENNNYEFWIDYEITPFEMETNIKSEGLQFVVNPMENRGYAFQLTKDISIMENNLIIKYKLENTGDKKIETTEYAHNFININDTNIGSDYTVKFPYNIKNNNLEEIFKVNDNQLTWKRTADANNQFYADIEGFENTENHWWKIINQSSGLGIKETNDFPAVKMAIWGKAHVVSPETFIKIDVAPGDVQEWTRRYTLFYVED